MPYLSQATAAKLANPDTMSDGILTPDLANDVKRLWQTDRGIKAAFARGTEFHLVESAQLYALPELTCGHPILKPPQLF